MFMNKEKIRKFRIALRHQPEPWAGDRQHNDQAVKQIQARKQPRVSLYGRIGHHGRARERDRNQPLLQGCGRDGEPREPHPATRAAAPRHRCIVLRSEKSGQRER